MINGVRYKMNFQQLLRGCPSLFYGEGIHSNPVFPCPGLCSPPAIYTAYPPSTKCHARAVPVTAHSTTMPHTISPHDSKHVWAWLRPCMPLAAGCLSPLVLLCSFCLFSSCIGAYQRLVRRLDGWKRPYLSIGGCDTQLAYLIFLVTFSMLNILVSVAQKIEKIQKNSFDLE